MSDVTDGIIAMPFELAMGTEVARRQFHGCAVAEVNRLKSELECALGDLATAKTIAERNMNNADRYRLLRAGHENNGSISDDGGCLWVWDWRGCNYEECGIELCGEELDGVVDSLIAKERT